MQKIQGGREGGRENSFLQPPEKARSLSLVKRNVPEGTVLSKGKVLQEKKLKGVRRGTRK